MKSRVSKLVSMLCVAAMLVSALPVSAAVTSDTGLTAGGWFETIYAELPSVRENTVTAVSYSGAMSGSLTGEDLAYLVRDDGKGGTRIDIPGLKAGTYGLTVTAGGKTYNASGIEVQAYDRSGFAHYNYTEGVGAYNDDGTLKANAKVVYVTEANKNTVELSFNGTVVKGIGNILNSVGQESSERPGYCKRTSGKSVYWAKPNTNQGILKKLADANVPLVVRIIGNVKSAHPAPAAGGIDGLTAYNSWDYGGSVKDNGSMARARDCKNITIEGIGPDACMNGWGIHFMASSSTPTYGKNFEVRNIAFRNVPEDCIGMEGVQDGSTLTAPILHGWVHNCSFYAPSISPAAESDKNGGDGACDFKRGEYFTMDYCYYEGYHKTNLVGSSDTSLQYNITWHHNLYKDCQSRGPLGRQANMHIYNCWYDSQSNYAMNPRANCYIFSEYNTFEKCKNPVEVTSGAVKSFNDAFTSCGGENAATVVTDKSQKVDTANKYKNFDTDPSSYIARGQYKLDESVVTAKKNIKAYAGVIKAADKVIKPEDVNTSILQANRIPSDYVPLSGIGDVVSLTLNKNTISEAQAKKILVNPSKSSNDSLTLGGTVGQDIVFKVAYDVYIAITEASGSKNRIALLNSNGETLVVGSGRTDKVPADTYIIQSSFYDVGTGKYKEANISKLEIERAGDTPTIVDPQPTEPDDPTPPGPTDPDDPDNPGGGEVVSGTLPTASSIIHDFTADGKNSTFYTINGNLSTSKGTVNYNNLTLTQCLKMESSTNIKFTAPKDGTLTLVFVSGGRVKLDGKEVSAQPTVTVTVSQGEHTITKRDSINLFYMFYTPKSDHTQHTWGEWKIDTPATCMEPGVKTHYCTQGCGASQSEEIPVIDHHYVNGVCDMCGASEGGEPSGPVEVTAVVLSRSSANLKVGGSVTLTATVSPSNAADKTVTWTSSNTAVATVSNGVVTAVAAGTATITAAAGDKSATCTVTVKAAATEQKNTYTFDATKNGSLSEYEPVVSGKPGANSDPKNYFNISGEDVKWKAGGSSTSPDTSKTVCLTLPAKGVGSLDFTVADEATAKVTINWSSTSSKNSSVLALIGPDGNRVADENGKDIFLVVASQDGRDKIFSGLQKGTYKIVAPEVTAEDKAALGIGADVDITTDTGATNPNARGARIYTVSVEEIVAASDTPDDTVDVDAVTVTPATATLDVGGTATLTAAVTPSNATNKTVTWVSSNTAVATVANGVVTAVASGEAIITATADGVNGMCTVTVNGSGTPPAPVVVERRALTAAIANAEVMKGYMVVNTAADNVPEGSQWVTATELNTFNDAITAAKAVRDDADATQAQVNSAVTTLKAAAEALQAARKAGAQRPETPETPSQPETPSAERKVYTLEADVVFAGVTPNADDGKTPVANPIYNFAAAEKLANQGTNGYFTICGNATAGKTKVDYNHKDFEEESYSSDYRINFGGKVDAAKEQSAIKFTTDGPAEVKVWWVQGGDDNRPMSIMDGTKAVIDETSGTYTKNSPYFDTLTIPAAGTYFLGGRTNNNNIYKVVVTVTPAGSGDTTPDTPDTPDTSEEEKVNKDALTAAITAAKTDRDTTTKTSTDGKDVSTSSKWVMKEDKEAYTIGILAAQSIIDDENATQTQVNQAVADLAAATAKFDDAKADGTKSGGSSGDGGGSSGGGGGGSVTPPKTDKIVDTTITLDGEVKDSVAVAELTDSQANTLANNAVKNNSENIIVSVNASKDAGTVRLNVSADALKNISAKTDAALTVETSAGDVKLPSASLADLGGNSGRTVAILVSKTDNGVKLTIGVGNKIQDKLAGGVTAVVPAQGEGSVAYLVAADGSEKLLKKSYVDGGKLHANLPGSGTIVLKDNAKSFRDVDGSWAKSAIDFAASRELFNGVNELDFAPNQAMTRSMLVTVLYRLEGAKSGAANKFADVPADSWYTEAVAWANAEGIVSGKSATHFGPDDDITREQLATILYRYATKLCGMDEATKDSKALEKFSDKAVVSGFAADGMAWCVEQGIVGGRGDGTLAPGGFASRAEVATMLMRFVKAII